ncbi:MAG: hypothetical protein QW341_02880 [Candidatus Bathyarchaeia archaeon]
MGKLVNVSVKVPKELRDLMRKVDVNWSEYLREVIEMKVSIELSKMALNTLDEIRRRVQEIPMEELVKWIREDREIS